MPIIGQLGPTLGLLLTKPIISRRTLASINFKADVGAIITQTTSVFTPNANTLLVVIFFGSGNQAVGPSSTYNSNWTVSSSPALVWTNRQNVGATFIINNEFSGSIGCWTAFCNGSVAATVTVSHPTASNSNQGLQFGVYELTGANIASPIGGVATGANSQGQAAATLTIVPAPSRYSIVFGYRGAITGGSETFGATPGSLFTELHDLQPAAGYPDLQVQERIGMTSPLVDWLDLADATITIESRITAAIEIV